MHNFSRAVLLIPATEFTYNRGEFLILLFKFLIKFVRENIVFLLLAVLAKT